MLLRSSTRSSAAGRREAAGAARSAGPRLSRSMLVPDLAGCEAAAHVRANGRRACCRDSGPLPERGGRVRWSGMLRTVWESAHRLGWVGVVAAAVLVIAPPAASAGPHARSAATAGAVFGAITPQGWPVM